MQAEAASRPARKWPPTAVEIQRSGASRPKDWSTEKRGAMRGARESVLIGRFCSVHRAQRDAVGESEACDGKKGIGTKIEVVAQEFLFQ